MEDFASSLLITLPLTPPDRLTGVDARLACSSIPCSTDMPSTSSSSSSKSASSRKRWPRPQNLRRPMSSDSEPLAIAKISEAEIRSAFVRGIICRAERFGEEVGVESAASSGSSTFLTCALSARSRFRVPPRRVFLCPVDLLSLRPEDPVDVEDAVAEGFAIPLPLTCAGSFSDCFPLPCFAPDVAWTGALASCFPFTTFFGVTSSDCSTFTLSLWDSLKLALVGVASASSSRRAALRCSGLGTRMTSYSDSLFTLLICDDAEGLRAMTDEMPSEDVWWGRR